MAKIDTTRAKVVFLYGGQRQLIPGTFGRSYAFCKWWISQHKDDTQYQGGVLKAVSCYVKIGKVKKRA